MKKVILTLVSLCVISIQHAPAQNGGLPKRILFIHSYHKEYSFTEEEERGIISALLEEGISYEGYVHFLDAKRFIYDKRHRELARHLSSLYESSFFDLVMVTDNDALNFAVQYRSSLFTDTPIVFTGINEFYPDLLGGEQNITGVAELNDMKGTIDFARSLFPERDYLVFILDNTASSIAVSRELAALRTQYASEITFIYLWLGRLYFTEILELLHQYEGRSIVFPLQMNIDRDGTYYSVEQGMKRVRGATSAPMFTPAFPHYLYGVIGGNIIHPYDLGFAAGHIAARILKGEDPASIPVQLNIPNRFLFNYEYLQKYNIPNSALPLGAEIFNLPPPFWQQHAGIIPYILLLLAAETVTIFLLVDALRRNKQFQTMLQRLVKEKEMLVREVNHRVKNNLATVKSLLSIQKSTSSDSSVLGALGEAENRIQSISLIHRLLYGSFDSKTIDVLTYLEELTSGIRDSFQTEKRGVTIQLEVSDVKLEADVVRNIGLIVNEAITNALKHAFNGGGGTIHIRLSHIPVGQHRRTAALKDTFENQKDTIEKMKTASQWILTIEDNGKGIPADKPVPSDSLGFTIMQSLSETLQAAFTVESVHPDLDRPGTRVTVIFPAASPSI